MSSMTSFVVPLDKEPPGLANLGNTCFFNAVLQCLGSVVGVTEGMDPERRAGSLEQWDNSLKSDNFEPPSPLYKQACVRAWEGSNSSSQSSNSSASCDDRCDSHSLPRSQSSGATLQEVTINPKDTLAKTYLLPITVRVEQDAHYMAEEFGRLMFKIQNPSTSSNRAVSPKALFSLIGAKVSRFRGYRQQDAQELLHILLDLMLMEELKSIQTAVLDWFLIPRESGKSFYQILGSEDLTEAEKAVIRQYAMGGATYIEDTFGGFFSSVIECHTCKEKTQTLEPFMDISLSIPNEDGRFVSESSIYGSRSHQSSHNARKGKSKGKGAKSSKNGQQNQRNQQQHRVQAPLNKKLSAKERKRQEKEEKKQQRKAKIEAEKKQKENEKKARRKARDEAKKAILTSSTVSSTDATGDEPAPQQRSSRAMASQRSGTQEEHENSSASSVSVERQGRDGEQQQQQQQATARSRSWLKKKLSFGRHKRNKSDTSMLTMTSGTLSTADSAALAASTPEETKHTSGENGSDEASDTLLDGGTDASLSSLADPIEVRFRKAAQRATTAPSTPQHSRPTSQVLASNLDAPPSLNADATTALGDDHLHFGFSSAPLSDDNHSVGSHGDSAVAHENAQETTHDDAHDAIGDAKPSVFDFPPPVPTTKALISEVSRRKTQKPLIDNEYCTALPPKCNPKTLEGCLANFCSEETLQGPNQYACEHCGSLQAKMQQGKGNKAASKTKKKNKKGTSANHSMKKQDDGDNDSDNDNDSDSESDRDGDDQGCAPTVKRDATKRWFIHTPPSACLVLHLKRFQRLGYRLNKKMTSIKFPLILDLAPYCPLSCQTRELKYALCGVCVHQGGMGGGHYVAYVKRGEEWYYCSDSLVRKVRVDQVLACEAYLLFYVNLAHQARCTTLLAQQPQPSPPSDSALSTTNASPSTATLFSATKRAAHSHQKGENGNAHSSTDTATMPPAQSNTAKATAQAKHNKRNSTTTLDDVTGTLRAELFYDQEPSSQDSSNGTHSVLI